MRVKGLILGLIILIMVCGNAYAQSTTDYDDYEGLIGFTFCSYINISYDHHPYGMMITRHNLTHY
jgi:hypothetical protein